MKKILALLLSLVIIVGLFAACGSPKAAESDSGAGTETAATGDWAPSKNVEWFVASSPGGGSDIFTRMITDIMKTEDIVDANMLVTTLTDGGGEVARNQVAHTAKAQADHTLLTLNSGCLMPMVDNTDNRIEDFTPLAVMAIDKQLLFVGENSEFASFEDVIKKIESGGTVVVGGSKGDDIATYELTELGFTQDQMPYISSDSTSEAITSILGEHIDIVLSKPAASAEYVEAGNLVPILALSTDRFEGNLADAPTLSEVDSKYADVEFPVWRGIVGPKEMSPEAAAYWSAALEKVSETDRWEEEYISKNLLIPEYMNHDNTCEYMESFQAEYLAGKEA